MLTTDDYFKGKRVVLFALPGAFTPTCSSTHLPGYETLYKDILAQGIDEVYCLSVNDVCWYFLLLLEISLTLTIIWDGCRLLSCANGVSLKV